MLLVCTGIVIRTLLLIGSSFSRADLGKIVLSFIAGAYVAAELETLLGLPLGMVICLAFFYKNKIITSLTEGALLLFALTGLFVYTATPNQFFSDTFAATYILPFLVVYVIVTLFLCIAKVRLPFFTQVLMVVGFLLTNVYIAYQTGIHVLVFDPSPIAQVLVGFYGLHFASNILYILNFIPIPLRKTQSFRERWHEVRAHAMDLEEKYIDIDLHSVRTLGVVALIGALFFTTWLFPESLMLSLAVVLALGSHLTSPPTFSVFTPQHIQKML